MHVMHVMFRAFCMCVLHVRETCFTEGKKVSKRESNLWITFLLPFWHEGNVGNLKVPFFLMALLCTRAHPDNLLA